MRQVDAWRSDEREKNNVRHIERLGLHTKGQREILDILVGRVAFGTRIGRVVHTPVYRWRDISYIMYQNTNTNKSMIMNVP